MIENPPLIQIKKNLVGKNHLKNKLMALKTFPQGLYVML